MRFLPLLTIAFLLIISCTGNKTANENDRDSTADSTVADSLAALKEPETLSMMPDTAFESASLVKFRVDTYCDSVDSVINDLRSLYDGKPGVFAFRGSPSRQADFGGKVDDGDLDEWLRLLREVDAREGALTLKTLAVKGKDLIGLGIAPGKQVGALLNRLLDLVLAGELPNQREALLEYLRKM